jgi:hypothetical protein
VVCCDGSVERETLDPAELVQRRDRKHRLRARWVRPPLQIASFADLRANFKRANFEGGLGRSRSDHYLKVLELDHARPVDVLVFEQNLRVE